MGCQRGLTTYLCSKGENWVFGSPKLATSGCLGHAAGPAALPLKADLQAAMSASPPILSASPPGVDLPGDAPVCLVLTLSGH